MWISLGCCPHIAQNHCPISRAGPRAPHKEVPTSDVLSENTTNTQHTKRKKGVGSLTFQSLLTYQIKWWTHIVVKKHPGSPWPPWPPTNPGGAVEGGSNIEHCCQLLVKKGAVYLVAKAFPRH